MKKKITIITFLLAVCALVWMPGIQAQAKEPVIVVIDPGHGGEENRGGEVLPHYVEKNLTLQVAQAMKQTLEQFEGVEVYLTRTTDQELSLEQRAQIAKAYHADFLFSLHFNMSAEHNLYGTEVWTSAFGKYYTAGQTFGRLQLAEMSQYGLYNKGVKTRLNSRGTDYYGVIRASRALDLPCVIIEHCYMDHPIDSPQANTPQKLANFGVSDAIAVAKYFHLKSASLGLDFSNYQYSKVPAPAGGVAVPDSTPPENVNMVITNADLKTGKVDISLSASDPQSGMLYYSYSIDGGITWSVLTPWAGGNTIQFSITVPGGSQPIIMCRAYNGYDYHTDSNFAMPGVFAAR